MKALTCEMCGSTNLIKEGGVFVCQSCGTKYSVEEAKKMMVEGTVDVKGTVKLDTTDELNNLYEIARRAKDAGNCENAAKYYEMILVKDPSNWEANFYTVYFQSKACKLGEISTAANNIANNLDTVLDLIKQNVTDIESQKKAVIEVWDNTTDIAGLFYETTVDHYNKYIDVKGQAASSSNTIMAIIDMSYKLGDLLVTKFDNNTFKDEIINAWRQGVDYTIASSKLFLAANVQLRALMNGTAEKYSAKMQRLAPDTKIPKVSSGCMLLLLFALSPLLAFLTYHILSV